ncbi:MAG TPA: hypothetical protein VGH99_16055 [Pseudonocardia sp.]
MDEDPTSRGNSVDLRCRRTAYGLVRSVMCAESGGGPRLAEARGRAGHLLADTGAEELTGVAVELALSLASALERVAADRGVVAVDLATGSVH